MSTARNESRLSRRTFLKGATAAAAAAGIGSSALYGCAPKQPSAEKAEEAGEEAKTATDTVMWSGCASGQGCGCCTCPIQYHVKDGEIVYVEGDTTAIPDSDDISDDIQARACLRGRTGRRFINSPDRLKYPMKRVGKRGEGKFEQISWDEAIDLLAEKIKYTIDTYGNEAIFNCHTGQEYTDYPLARLLHLVGGYLGYYGQDSDGQIRAGLSLMYGRFGGARDEEGNWVEADEAYSRGSSILEAKKADLLIMFGNNLSGTSMSGGAGTYDMAKVRAAGTKIINIDVRLNETSSGFPEEWVPIRPGTDAALASAMAYVLITENMIDKEFLDKYCVGYDETTMPEGAPANSSYKDYILGTGYDMVPKTPEWAAPITQIPTEKIYELARELGNAKSAFITQGWATQRRSNGENTVRAIAMLAVLTGQIGLPGTNNGAREASSFKPGAPGFSMPGGENPVKTKVSCLSRIDIIDHGSQMTADHDGVRGKDKLDTDVKLVLGYFTNALVNQHGDINHTHEVLSDESKAEFIALWDVVMTPSAKYADLVLPDAMRTETYCIGNVGNTGASEGVFFGTPISEPKFEARPIYDVLAEVADRLGVKEEFTEGRTWKEWQEHLYEELRKDRPDLPTLEEGYEMGFWSQALTETEPKFKAFRDDPEANPLSTASGKIEIYCEDVAKLAQTWKLDHEEDILSPIPIYNPGYESYEDANETYPLVLSAWHPRSRYHSTFAPVEEIAQAMRHQIWINPIDAEARGIENGDMTRVFNDRGEVHIEARVTPRIIPGAVAMPEGTWHKADMDGDRIDKGGNVNVLTKNSPASPLAKHNPSNSNIVQVEKL